MDRITILPKEERSAATSAPAFDVMLTIVATDPPRLWDAAAARLRSSGLDPDDIDDTIGIRLDPRIEDCLATLLMPHRVDGGDFIAFAVKPAVAFGR